MFTTFNFFYKVLIFYLMFFFILCFYLHLMSAQVHET